MVQYMKEIYNICQSDVFEVAGWETIFYTGGQTFRYRRLESYCAKWWLYRRGQTYTPCLRGLN
jgi:hypothetical protein